MDPKDAAAAEAVRLVQPGMVLGIGSGSTAAFAIARIGERIRTEGLTVRGIPTSSVSAALAAKVGIPLIDFDAVGHVDMTIDGADEVDPDLHLIKGGGGALVREKIVAAASRQVVIIVDPAKVKPVLGAFPLPIAVFQFGWQATLERLRRSCPAARLRTTAAGAPYVTDDGLYIVDAPLGAIPDPPAAEREIGAIAGVAEVGLFTALASRAIVGYPDGRTETLLPAAAG